MCITEFETSAYEKNKYLLQVHCLISIKVKVKTLIIIKLTEQELQLY